MYKIFYDNTKFSVLIDGVQNSDGHITVDTDKSCIITLLPIYEHTVFIPISSLIWHKNNTFYCKIPYITLNINEYFLTPKFMPYITSTTPCVDIQREFGEHIITVYTDNVPKLLIENKSTFVNVVLPEKPIKMQEAIVEKGILFYCLCKHYMCVILYDYNDYNVLIDKQCYSYEFDNSGVSFQVHLNDNQGRIYSAHLSFDGNDYICDRENYSYTNKHAPCDKLLCYDFMQAIIADDLEYAEKMLSASCPQSINNIANECSLFDNLIIPCIYYPNYVFATSNGNTKKCLFEIEKNKISHFAVEK